MYLFKEKISLFLLSAFGGLTHNVGQIAMAAILLKNTYLFYYLPVMVIAGIACGMLTGVSLKYTMPYLQRLDQHNKV